MPLPASVPMRFLHIHDLQRLTPTTCPMQLQSENHYAQPTSQAWPSSSMHVPSLIHALPSTSLLIISNMAGPMPASQTLQPRTHPYCYDTPSSPRQHAPAVVVQLGHHSKSATHQVSLLAPTKACPSHDAPVIFTCQRLAIKRKVGRRHKGWRGDRLERGREQTI